MINILLYVRAQNIFLFILKCDINYNNYYNCELISDRYMKFKYLRSKRTIHCKSCSITDIKMYKQKNKRCKKIPIKFYYLILIYI
jgi:hypothetical protein